MNFNYPGAFSNQMKRSLARAFVTGEFISGSADYQDNLWPEVKELYNRTVRASTTYAKNYLFKGRPLKPPTIDVPKHQVDWYFYSQSRPGRPFNESTVLNSLWLSDEGNIGHVFVNWNASTIEFDLDLLPYGPTTGNYTVYLTRNGNRSILYGRTELPRSVHLKLDSLDVVLIEIIRNPEGNYTFLYPGWNLISIPFIQSDTGLGTVLSSIAGEYDAVRWYDTSDTSDPWKNNHAQKLPSMNDLNTLDHKVGFWIYITNLDGVLFEYFGSIPGTSQDIQLSKGWNLIGYPSLASYNRTDGLNNTMFGTHINKIIWYNASSGGCHSIGENDYFIPGRGYWFHAKEQVIWNVPI
jgi:hypothetical protein